MDRVQGRAEATSLHDYWQQWRLRVEPAFGTRALSSITHAEIVEWVGRLAGTVSGSTAWNSFVMLSGILRMAVADRVLVVDPSAGVALPEERKVEARPLSYAEVARLVALRAGDLDVGRGRVRVSRSISEVGGRMVESTPKSGRGWAVAACYMETDLTAAP